jgi:hypothetical protein
MDAPHETWLRCLVSPGMFDNEIGVDGRQFDGSVFSFFGPDDAVEPEQELTSEKSVPGRVRVEIMSRKGNLVVVKLPRQTFQNGAFITVTADQLETRVARQEVCSPTIVSNVEIHKAMDAKSLIELTQAQQQAIKAGVPIRLHAVELDQDLVILSAESFAVMEAKLPKEPASPEKRTTWDEVFANKLIIGSGTAPDATDDLEVSGDDLLF